MALDHLGTIYSYVDDDANALKFKSKASKLYKERGQIILSESIEKWIKDSIEKANKESISGKELTPFLINEMNMLSNNKTLDANMELIIDNAKIAGKLANKYFLI